MAEKYESMDKMTSEEIAEFKEAASDKEFKLGLKAVSGRAGAAKVKKLVAEGDSWFNYLPGIDVIDCLRYHHGYSIKNYAKAGDTLENMIYGTEINNEFERVSPSVYRVLRKIKKIKLGGNPSS